MTTTTLRKNQDLFTLTHGTETISFETFWAARDALKALALGRTSWDDLMFDCWGGAEPVGCECELDWNCPLHADRMFTAIERINDAASEPDYVTMEDVQQAQDHGFYGSI